MHRPMKLASIAGLAAALLACSKPEVGPKVVKVVPDTAPKAYAVTLTQASVNGDRKPLVDLAITYGGVKVTLADATALKPTFTLAELTTDPESGLASWKSLLLTGSQTAAANPIGGPGTKPENVLAAQKQPGSEATGTLTESATGFQYLFANALPAGFATGHTYRIGVWLNGVSAGTAETSGTLDFVPGGGTPAPRDLVADADCQRCHAEVLAHGRRVGVRLCTTCHTWQAVDPDTVDPAAPLAATAATNPNPVDFGRMVHRIHRGKNLPTLYAASSAAAAPALGSATPALPFLPGRNAAVVGRKFTIVGHQSRAFTFGEVKAISTPDGTTIANRAFAGGVVFPRDYRDCDACHEKAAQGEQAYTAISRRTCAGCHPDVWFDGAVPPDTAHLAHTGGPQADDTACVNCHLAPGGTPKLYVDNREVHTPLTDHERFSPITASIVSVTNLLPGQKPTVVFTLADRTGPLSPLNDATTPPPVDSAAKPSPVPRKVTRLAFVLSGPTSPDHLTSNVPLSEAVTEKLVADGDGRFTYTFKTVAVPETATGAWSVMLETRRQLTPRSPIYDQPTDTFSWPYTAEAITEFGNNPIVDVAISVGDSATPALARRTVVDVEKCNACHKRILLHGGNRQGVSSCLLCHTPDQTDWAQRPKLASGNVSFAATLDGIEERSVHFKTMIHRIHTGGREGIAQLDAEPFLIYGFGKNPLFFDEGVFPNDLANCRVCHAEETFRLEAIPVDAAPTVANETPTLQHKNTAAHATTEAKLLPMSAACTSCHDTGTARDHASRNVVNGVEACISCHGESAAYSVYGLHGVERP